MPSGAKKEIERRQRRWAAAASVAVDARGYVRDAVSNLRAPIAAGLLAAFARGSELTPGRTRPARMLSLCSSAALVANVFGYWSERDAGPLLDALGIARESARLCFEEPLPTGLEGDPPTVDVAVRLSSGGIVGIESKFAEWLARRPRNKAQFKHKYFPHGERLWARAGLPLCQALAEDLQSGAERFKHLHAVQLLKHTLGLAMHGPRPPALRYLYYDWPGREAAVHAAEIERFAARVGSELGFAALTYQRVHAVLAARGDVAGDYLAYLRARYFP